MIRSLKASDVPQILGLIGWMKAAPEREVGLPRDWNTTNWQERYGQQGYLVEVDDEGEVGGYCGLRPFRDGQMLEGPLGNSPADLIARAKLDAGNQPLYAVVARENAPMREALEAQGFGIQDQADYYVTHPARLAQGAKVPKHYETENQLTAEEYIALYHASQDAFPSRQNWSDEQLAQHFADPNVVLVALRQGGEALGFAELELRGERAELNYFAIRPDQRGQGLGARLLALAAAEAAARNITELQARALSHMQAGRALYEKAGMQRVRTLLTYRSQN